MKTTNVAPLFHSVCSLYNCEMIQASHWASKTSKRYKAYVRSEGESGDQTYHSRGRDQVRTVVEECGCERTLVVEKDKTTRRRMKNLVIFFH